MSRHGMSSQAFPVIFHRSSASVCYIEQKSNDKKMGSAGNEASIPLSFHVDMYHISVICNCVPIVA